MLKQIGWNVLGALAVSAALSAQAPPDGPGGGGWRMAGAGPGAECPPPMMAPGGPRPGPLGGPHQGPEGGPQGMPMLRLLNLSQAQKQSVKAILDRHQAEQRARHRTLDDRSTALRDGLEDPARSEAQLRALQAAENEARLQVVLEQRAVFLEIRAVLSPEQQAKAERLRLKMQKERDAHREVMAEMGDARPDGPPPFAPEAK